MPPSAFLRSGSSIGACSHNAIALSHWRTRAKKVAAASTKRLCSKRVVAKGKHLMHLRLRPLASSNLLSTRSTFMLNMISFALHALRIEMNRAALFQSETGTKAQRKSIGCTSGGDPCFKAFERSRCAKTKRRSPAILDAEKTQQGCANG